MTILSCPTSPWSQRSPQRRSRLNAKDVGRTGNSHGSARVDGLPMIPRAVGVLCNACPCLLAALAAVACSSLGASGPRSGRVEVSVEQSSVPGPAGWIYAFKRRSGHPDACVYVWADGRWELGEATEPGAYLQIKARGRIEGGVLVALPVDVLREADELYQAGHISARLDGVLLPAQGG